MLIGYVSDERFVALPDVVLEFIGASGESWDVRSRASGAVHLDLPPDKYRVVLQKSGYGAKFSRVTVPGPTPHHFRLLSDGLLGYAWPKWVRSGEPSEFRVHSIEPYKLELWRYGWRPEFVRALGWHDEHGPRAVMQITPDGDYTQTGAEWNKVGYANSVHSQHVAGPARSGLYYFRASTASGRQFSFPWIVAPARPTAKMAVLASNFTWNAYNNFGGRSNYIHADGLPPTPTINARAELKRYSDSGFFTWGADQYPPLSFDRPEPFNHIDFAEQITDPIGGRQACHLAPAEWRLLGWLERQGFAYDYFAETQLDDGTLDLSQYRVLVLAVHPEYWTPRMYARVKRWVFEEGGRLVYLGGNGLNCAVELLPTGAVLHHNGTIAGLDVAGLGGYESRYAMRHESEANLLGCVFTPAGAMTGAPYRVLDASHWAFAGTGLKTGDTFGEKCLHMRCPGGASGHETDKASPHSPNNAQVIARGLNPDNGGADMLTFNTPSGGEVFSVGSINFVASLPVDETVSRITENVLRRFLS
ncbi:N,N-dimethylformamidase beta subunit [Gemmata sp. SH-PL17]|uniref:N,N-dimethylformamidase beta subunit family domain-containing protein n=1 Tax=Gemmata sp. SH-PL17 TaxID=1630693 RepID=UPI00078B3514|nr:N,N-dimethylformamidase beta subunit family domain-containing protein [Gemmata sp. SH-PL17]AMV28264.1 N,N-dimethylformamidase beta subunit [Gemmata sp. SH-PL17]